MGLVFILRCQKHTGSKRKMTFWNVLGESHRTVSPGSSSCRRTWAAIRQMSWHWGGTRLPGEQRLNCQGWSVLWECTPSQASESVIRPNEGECKSSNANIKRNLVKYKLLRTYDFIYLEEKRCRKEDYKDKPQVSMTVISGKGHYKRETAIFSLDSKFSPLGMCSFYSKKRYINKVSCSGY